MRIAIVTNSFVRSEGQGRVNMELARRATEAGWEVTCVAHTVSPELLVYPRVSWVKMPDANWPIALLGNQFFAQASTRWLSRFGDDYDLTLANGFTTWYPVDVNVVHFVHSAWLQSPVHDMRVRSGPRAWYQGLYTLVNTYLERQVLERTGHVVAVSEKVREELAQLGIDDRRMKVIHNGVDLEEFSPGAVDRKALGLPPDVPLALFAGDIRTRRKNLDTILHAAVGVPDLHLAVAGRTDGSPFPALSRELGLTNRVHFLGFRKDVADLMRAADFFVFPSRYEACSLVILEAMAAGLPIIAAETTGGAELISEDMGIVLPDPDDVRALTEAFQLLTHDEHRRGTMSRTAREQAEQHSWSRMGDEYLKLFADLMQNPTHSVSTTSA